MNENDSFSEPQGSSSENPLDFLIAEIRSVSSETRAEAYKVALKALPERCLLSCIALREAGPFGLTRHELAEKIDVRLQTICSVAKAIRDGGLAREVGKRPTPSGSNAAVLIWCEHLENEVCDDRA